MVKVHILSDLHNEFLEQNIGYLEHPWTGEIPDVGADIIALAGDIDVGLNGVKWAIEESERLSIPILYVLGNHEFYYNEYFRIKDMVKKLADGTGVTILDKDEFYYRDVRFMGVTLWTDYGYPSVSHKWAMEILDDEFLDHQVIHIERDGEMRHFKTRDALFCHTKEKNFLKEALDKGYDGKTVVITHHGPHMACNHPGFPVSEFSLAFDSDQSAFFEQYSIDAWIFGHTHANIDLDISGTRLVSNQAGYPGERVEGFDAGKVIIV